jgi:ferredoxin-NADP reductase
VSSSVLAVVTTVHVSMLVVRRHRTRPSGGKVAILLPAAIFASIVWVVPKPDWLGAGLALHAVWFLFCEKQFPNARVSVGRTPSALSPASTPKPALGARSVAAVAPAPSSSRAPIAVPVLAVFDETPDIKTFRVSRPEHFDFVAGQFLTVRVQIDGKSVQRAYSISSAPHLRGYLEISVKRIGLVSGVLHSTLRRGSLLTVRAPAGGFTYPHGDDRPLLLLAGGIGITPVMSMLRHAVADQPARPVALIYSVRTPADIAFRDELSTIARRHPQVRVVVTVTQAPASDQWLHGRVTPDVVRPCVPDLSHALAYICGPEQMIASMKSLLQELGMPAAHVRSESFGAAMKLVTTEAEHEESAAPAVARAAAAPLTIRFALTGCEGRIGPRETLLEAAEARGVDLPFVCRSGSCHTCRTKLLAGDVECLSDSLSDEERAAGYILPCVTHARSDCELEA